VDAILECENGHTLRAELRWRTPEETHRVNTPDLTILTAAPKGSVTTDVAVTNAGSAPVGLGSLRLLDADMSTAAPLSVVGSTCVRLASRPPGQTPTGTHQRPDTNVRTSA
jgi:hypothetical protein